MYIRRIIFAMALLIAGFTVGYGLGSAPLRHSLALSGGAAGQIAVQLQASSMSLNWPDGRARSVDEIIRKQVRSADLDSVLAAQFYCQMDPSYRHVAKKAANQLSVSSYVSKDGNKEGFEARSFIAQAKTSSSAECVRFEPSHSP